MPVFTSRGFRIGALDVSTRVLMAPMMGYNEPAMRRIFRRFGSGLALTEMIKPEKLLRGDAQLLRELPFNEDERPLGAQICGRDPEPAVAAALDLRRRGYDLIDLNMGCPLKKEVARGFTLRELSLYEWNAAAQDAGVSPKGSGFRGASFHFIVDSSDAVDEVIGKAVSAGGQVVKKAEASQWGGYFGYFSDLDGYLWKVATSS